jgi:hypothetical protein
MNVRKINSFIYKIMVFIDCYKNMLSIFQNFVAL